MSGGIFSSVRYRVSSMKIEIMTLFPEVIEAFLSSSILGRAVKNGCFSYACRNIRDYSENKHKNVDDTPYGGGCGMLMAAPPILRCFEDILRGRPTGEKRRVIYLSPRGKQLTQTLAEELAASDALILLCGHYEGVDQRALDLMEAEEVSIGDFVLTGGELPACALIDAVVRLLPGVLAEPACYRDESIASGLLEYPQYTRPPVVNGCQVPEILLSGDHKKIAAWRLAQSLALTEERRPDLYAAYLENHPASPREKKRKARIKSGK